MSNKRKAPTYMRPPSESKPKAPRVGGSFQADIPAFSPPPPPAAAAAAATATAAADDDDDDDGIAAELPDKLRALYSELDRFVAQATEGRDPTHGHAHMKKVCANALTICASEGAGAERTALVVAVAWLHDVADHKYDKDGRLAKAVRTFCAERLWAVDGLGTAPLGAASGDELAQRVEAIVERVSYSKEARARRQGRALDWADVLGDEGCRVRDIVSDADKLEAIGRDGVVRCLRYAWETEPAASAATVADHVRRHAGEKLLLLKDLFFRTEAGRRLAEPLHLEMCEAMLVVDDLVAAEAAAAKKH